jgi:hypothetical protein
MAGSWHPARSGGGQPELLSWGPWIAVLFACLPYALGFPQGDDGGREAVRIAEYLHALEDGQYPPYWASNFYGGYGSPVFLYYAPLFSFVAAVLSKLLGSFAAGGTLAACFFTAVSAVSMHALMREILGRGDAAAEAAARISVYLYVLSPYLMVDKFVRGANAEFTALAILPIVLLGLMRIGREPLQGVLILSSGLALVILAHNLTALIALALLTLATVVLYRPWDGTGWRGLGYVALGVAFGFALSAFFWWPLIVFLPGVRMGDLTGLFALDAFMTPLALFGTGHPFTFGPFIPFILVLAVMIYFQGKVEGRTQQVLLFALSTAGLSLFLQWPISLPLWESIEALKVFQFPWRMMGVLALVSAMAGGMIVYAWGQVWTNRSRGVLEYLILALVVSVAIMGLMRTLPFIWRLDMSLEGLSAHAVRERDVRATSRHEYLPPGAQLESRSPPSQVEIRAGDRLEAVILACREGGEMALTVDLNEPRSLRFPVWEADVWAVRLNGRGVAYRTDEIGSMEVDLPAGHHEVRLRSRPPRARVWGVGVSMAAWGLWLALAMQGWRQRRETT